MSLNYGLVIVNRTPIPLGLWMRHSVCNLTRVTNVDYVYYYSNYIRRKFLSTPTLEFINMLCPIENTGMKQCAKRGRTTPSISSKVIKVTMAKTVSIRWQVSAVAKKSLILSFTRDSLCSYSTCSNYSALFRKSCFCTHHSRIISILFE